MTLSKLKIFFNIIFSFYNDKILSNLYMSNIHLLSMIRCLHLKNCDIFFPQKHGSLQLFLIDKNFHFVCNNWFL